MVSALQWLASPFHFDFPHTSLTHSLTPVKKTWLMWPWRVKICQTKPSKSLTKISKLVEASKHFELKLLNESKYSMPWVRCAFGNVCYRPLSWIGWCKWYVILMSGGLTADDSPVWFADQGGRLGLTNTTTALISSLPATLPPIRVSYTTLHSALDCCNVQKMRWLCN